MKILFCYYKYSFYICNIIKNKNRRAEKKFDTKLKHREFTENSRQL